MVFCYLSRMRVAKTQTSLHNRAVSPEPLLLAGVDGDPD